MQGIDRITGRALGGFDHLIQSIEVILTTRIGERVMRRTFGSHVPRLLGEKLITPVVLNFFTAIVIAIEIWEPRYDVISVKTASDSGAADRARLGRLGVTIRGNYMPRGHLGDFTISPADGLRDIQL